MAPLDVDMGYAQIQCLSCDLEVALTSSAQFAPSAKDDIIASLRRELNEQTEIATNGNAPYIRSGDSFKLVLSLQVDPTLEPASEDRLSHILVQQIQNAEIWRQLHFTPRSVQSSREGIDRHVITITLAHTDQSTLQRGLHQLDVDVPFYDVRPPDGSTAVTCNAVTLGLVLTKRHRKQARQRDRLYLDTYDQRTNGNALDTEDEYDLFDMYEPCTQYDANPPCPADCEEWLLDDNDDNRSNGGHIAVYQNEQTSEEDLLPWRPPLLKRRSSISVYDLFENQITAEYCARAVDAALRLAISGSRARLSKEFTVARANSIRPWQDTMPALWSPGYLPQLASRAAFMSTIADSLGSVVSCTAESSNTQHIDSATSSSKQSPTLATGVYQNSDSCRSSDADTVPCQLWSLLHSHFCQQQTTYHLRPLSVTAAHNANAPKSAESLDELLDPSQAELLEDSESLSSEDEDLYFDDDVQFLQDETSVNADETLDDLEDGCDHWSELEFVSQHDSCKSGGHGTALIVDSHDHFYQY